MIESDNGRYRPNPDFARDPLIDRRDRRVQGSKAGVRHAWAGANHRVATIESIRSSTRIECRQLSDRDVERLLANLEVQYLTDHCLGPVSVGAGRGDGRSSCYGFAYSPKVLALVCEAYQFSRCSNDLPSRFVSKGFADFDVTNGASGHSFLRRHHWHARAWKLMGKLARIAFGLRCNRLRGPAAYATVRIS